ncbi:NADP-dependent oxidoreductase [Chitinophaga arvensicola]|uniref:NADPH:quinone reductase n=1 Tax=Chitinophaga arvensicola TaxID=29529 RepID=A0A1I0QYK5_9BACT|nr:NADP-dependent oxidoreductase [Chitinophaga arvensicola]SEW32857.1 NADPH:quinone reductase [Chitinophaga arvensicola]
MKAIILEKLDKNAPLTLSATTIPAIAADEVLVETKAIGINPVDYKTLEDYTTADGLRASWAPSLDGISPLILGSDIAGIVTQVGSAVTKFKIGDEVFGMIKMPGHGRGFAEYVAAPAIHLAKKPANISFSEAAAATLAAITAWQNLHHHFQVKEGDRVLITAPAGGVGHYAVQMAKAAGAHVIAVTNAAQASWVLALGADEVIDYQQFDFEKAADLQLNLVLDAGGRYPAALYEKHFAPGAALFFLPHGLPAATTSYYQSKGFDVRFTGVTSDEKAIDAIAVLLASGKVKSYIGKTFAFNEMRAAMDEMKKGTTKGKIVVTL